MKEVLCPLQEGLLLCSLQTIPPQALMLNIVSQSIEPIFAKEVAGALQEFEATIR